MNFNQQRPVGRGALLKKLASISPLSDESQRNISSSTSDEFLKDPNRTSSSESQDISYYSASSSSSSNGRTQGRGQLLQRLRHAQESMSNDAFKLDTPPKYGSGRGNMLKILNEVNKSTGNTNNDRAQNISNLFGNLSVERVVNKEEEPVIRKGTKGKEIQVMTNYLQLHLDSSKGVFEYEVGFRPAVHATKLRHVLLNQHKTIIGNTSIFDGVILYLPTKISNMTEVISQSPTDGASYHMTIIFKRKMKMTDCKQLYNLLFDKVMKKLEYVRYGRKKFDPTAPKIIPQHKLEVWPGYVTSVEEYEDGVMLNLDVSHRLLCQSTVLELLTKIFISDKENLRQLALSALLGSVILTRYNNRTYRIDDIDWNSSPTNTFLMNNREISYIEYYKSQYGIEIVDASQPLLISREERRVAGKDEKETITFCLIPEICYLTGITDALRSDKKVMRDIATITRVTPEQRMFAYRKFCNNVNNSPDAKQILHNWGLSLGEPRKLLGRQLNNETIFFGNGQCVADRGDFNKYVNTHNMLNVIDLKSWLVLNTNKDKNVTRSFIELMERNARPMGMNVCPPRVITLTDDKPESYVQALRKCINSSLQIIVTICPTNRDDRYAAIKKICCAELPIPTQVINARTLSNDAKNRAIVQKIALQMNCKMGGSLWAVKIPLNNVMICGIDTYHDTKKKQNSVSAFIASINPTFTKWFSRAIIQSQKEELLNGLCQSLFASLSEYYKANGMYPDKIIVFR
ncbi:Protein argonaute-3 [Pseudolycoriella hygida]|uniref:Protein argonaute-3 n=1 Tax=Pseudolycoriella hygida TaxID=35572 RepID=A0A9Q0S418_9DIPT|nr:Protein argonaute-3 [Pseudolycoriella hygida]